MNKINKLSSVEFMLLFVILTLSGLFSQFLQDNELAFLPWALHSADPSWARGDWVLSSGLRSQWLAGSIVGHLVNALGFYWGSIVARLVCYALLAIGFLRLSNYLRVPIPFVCSVIVVYVFFGQALAAGEWFIGAAEPKVFAMSMVLLALPFLLKRDLIPAAALIGAAFSFHVLIGGYACITAVLYSLLKRESISALFLPACAFLLTGSFGIYLTIEELFISGSSAEASRLMTHIRVPHHTLPAHFGLKYPIKILILASFIAVSWRKVDAVSRDVYIFAALTMVPFAFGLAVAPFDENGQILRFYPFRFGDILFPLLIPIAGYSFLRANLDAKLLSKMVATACVVAFGWQAFHAYSAASRLGQMSEDRSQWRSTLSWVSQNTPKDALILAPPGKEDFTMFSERAGIVQFKLSPFDLSMYPEWARRLEAVSGMALPETGGFELVPKLNNAYYSRPVEELENVMDEFGADYAITKCNTDKMLSEALYIAFPYCVLGYEGSNVPPASREAT